MNVTFRPVLSDFKLGLDSFLEADSPLLMFQELASFGHFEVSDLFISFAGYDRFRDWIQYFVFSNFYDGVFLESPVLIGFLTFGE